MAKKQLNKNLVLILMLFASIIMIGLAIVMLRQLQRTDPAQLVASSAKIRQALGWSPQQESVEAIVSSAWVWHQAHPHGYRN